MPKSSWPYFAAACLFGWGIFGALTAFGYWLSLAIGRQVDVVVLLVGYGVQCLLVLYLVIRIFRSPD